MSSDRWEEITALLEKALNQEGAPRDHFLAEIGKTDPHLESELRSLIVAHEGPGRVDELSDFLAGPQAEALVQFGAKRMRRPMLDSAGQSAARAASESIIARLNQALAGRYTVSRLLGSGGMAFVYLANDDRHGRSVAIKVLKPEVAAHVGAERFLREIEIAAGLNHPNILGLHDSGEADGLLYFVMPFVEGESLRARITSQGQLSLEDTVRIVGEVGGALNYAHGLGLVHRDIKPENILFQAGHALVCDFGIAKAATEATERLTQTGLAIGTLVYMSPEQATNQDAVDGRADVYALGCILQEMLTGEAPFAGATPQVVLGKMFAGKIPPVSDLRPDVPQTVQDVITKALQPTADERYETAADLVSAVQYATTAIATAERWKRRRREHILRSLVAVAVLATLVAGGRWLMSAMSGPPLEVLALVPMPSGGSDPDRDIFVQAVQQDLSLELAKAGIRIKSPSTVSRYAETTTSVGALADSLGVDAVVQVSASLTDRRAEIGLALIDGESEEFLWANEFAGEERDILAVYGNITRALASQIGVRLSSDVLARLDAAPEVDPAVFEALRNARFHWQALTEEGLETALDYYQLALSLDSTSAEAWNGIGNVWLVRSQQGLVSAEEANRLAEPALQRAAQLDPLLPEVQSSIAVRATWVEWDWERAETAFSRALEQDPLDSATRAYYSLLLLYLGRTEESADEIARAAEMDPFNTLVQGLRAQNLNARGLHAEAEEVLQEALTRERGAPFLLSTLRTTYHLMDRHDEALDMWRASLTDEGSYSATGDTAALAALERGNAEAGYRGALRAIAELYVERSATEHISPWRIGTLYTRAGANSEALDYLEAAYAARDQNCPYLSVDPIFDGLRNQPRFQALVDGLGLPR